MRVAVDGKVPIALVIGDDEKDVRLFRIGDVHRGEQREQQGDDECRWCVHWDFFLASSRSLIQAPTKWPLSWNVRPETRLPSITQGSSTNVPPQTSRSKRHLATVAIRRPRTQSARAGISTPWQTLAIGAFFSKK